MASLENETGEFMDDTITTYPEFDGMNLKDDILRGIYSYGFEKPSPIQQRAIIPLSQGIDLFAQAQSGTGKTGTFAIAILQRILFETSANENPQALILVPTRELAQQIKKVISSIGSYVDDKGGYGLTQFAYAIADNTKNLENIKTCMESDKFLKLMKLCYMSSGNRFDRKVLSTFKKDFWKEFLPKKIN
jgi:superfamily II DNA/RNA helicase